ncbi:uncharacterized protein LOC113216526 [Frankliniella occidentalis]|uniref:Uncharacterized protein LOC113216526 n=1 Tax=Frankliniella occidentalis TaxID=133901 RepID=A0A9C6TRV6_FRAOC|nr:uncharacterized protein LOC113216526 [Frankliniella occidentalis]
MKPLLKETEGSAKIILSRDIHNARAKHDRKERGGRSEEQMLIDKLTEIINNDPGACAHIEICKDSRKVKFILVQTTSMRNALKKFPEVLLTDITYKINKNLMPVSVVQVVDGAGVSQVVAYAILANELKATLTDMLLHFHRVSGGDEVFEKTNCVVVDKDYSEIGAIRAIFPNAKVHICSVHAERNLKTAAKGDPNKKIAMDHFREMLYSETEESFQEAYKKFRRHAGETLKNYFRDNWLNLKEAWCLKDRMLVETFRNHTTNRVENENQKLKMALTVDTPLYEAVDILVNMIQGYRKDALRYKDHEALTKRVKINNCSDEIVQTVCNDITLYAAKLVCEQFQLAKKPSPASAKYLTSDKDCSCQFYKTLKLTCRHIMRVRKQAGLNWYDKSLIPERYFIEYNTGWWKEDVVQPADNRIPPRMPAKPVKNIMGPSEKFKESRLVLDKLRTLLTEVGTREHHIRMQLLLDLTEAWSGGGEVVLVHLNDKKEGEGNAEKNLQDNSTSEDPGEKSPDIITIDSDSDDNFENVNATVVKSENVEDETSIYESNSDSGRDELNRNAPFNLPQIKIVGRPRGKGETIHDGSKQSSTLHKKSRYRAELCCVCNEPVLFLSKCGMCNKSVHAYQPCSYVNESSGMKYVCDLCTVFDHIDDGTEETMFEKETDRDADLMDDVMEENLVEQESDRGADWVKDADDHPNPRPESSPHLSDQCSYCAICGNEAGSHKCTKCGKTVHAIEPCSVRDPDQGEGFGKGCICTLCAASKPDPTPPQKNFALDKSKTKGRPKTTSRKYKPTWSFTQIADESHALCCICNKEAKEASKCQKCLNTVHSVLPCSLDIDDDKKICNYCCDFSYEDYYGEPPKANKKPSVPYFCFGCKKLLKLCIAKNPKDEGRKGDFYYSCLRNETSECKPLSFWAPKSDAIYSIIHQSLFQICCHNFVCCFSYFIQTCISVVHTGPHFVSLKNS